MESTARFQSAFGRIKYHRLIGRIIRRFSTNKENIYTLALSRLHFNKKVNVVDLGCGYGAFTGALKDVIPPGSRCTGIDIITTNCEPYLQTTESLRLDGSFLGRPAAYLSHFPDASLDIILSGYSLYFFPEIIPTLAQKLKPGGHLIVITHSLRNLQEYYTLLAELDSVEKSISNHLQRGLCTENGIPILQRHFKAVIPIVFNNQLVFSAGNLRYCFIYLDFKRAVIQEAAHVELIADDDRSQERIRQLIRRKAAAEGFLALNKDDCIFHCHQPLPAGQA